MAQVPQPLPLITIMPATAIGGVTRVFSSPFRVGAAYDPATAKADPEIYLGVLWAELHVILAGAAPAVNILFEAFRCRYGEIANRDTNPFFDEVIPCTGLSAFRWTMPLQFSDFGTAGVIAVSAVSAVSGWTATVELTRYRLSG